MKNSKIHLPVPSLNFHLWEPCNMRCKFCFATFQDVKATVLPKGHLPKHLAVELMHIICNTDVDKITFAGGEPTLCPWLYELVSIAKSYDKTTMIVTNGSRITKDWMLKYEKVLDWITLSVDSINDDINLKIGRAITGKKVISVDDYLAIGKLISKSKMRFKINTVGLPQPIMKKYLISQF